MSTGYTRKRSRTPTRRTTRPKSFRTAVKNVIEQSLETKYRNVMLSITETPGVGGAASAYLPYSNLVSGGWLTWGHLLSNIGTPSDGKVASMFERQGDEIHMRNMRFDIDLESGLDQAGTQYRFVVWKTSRVRDSTQNHEYNMNPYSEGLPGSNYAQRRFGAPPLIQMNQYGPNLNLSGVSTDTSSADYGSAKGASGYIGLQGVKYSVPTQDASKYEMDLDPVTAMIDTSRCTVLHDEVFDLQTPNNLRSLVNTGTVAAPSLVYTNQSPAKGFKCTRYVSYDKDIEFSNDLGSTSDLLLAYKNNNDYINCALVGMPSGQLANQKYADLNGGLYIGRARVVCTFSWKDKNNQRSK